MFVKLALPVCDVIIDDFCGRIDGKIAANGLDKVSLGVCVKSVLRA